MQVDFYKEDAPPEEQEVMREAQRGVMAALALTPTQKLSWANAHDYYLAIRLPCCAGKRCVECCFVAGLVLHRRLDSGAAGVGFGAG